MKYLPYLENHNFILGLIGKETCDRISKNIKLNAREISHITNIPLEEIRFNNYETHSEYKKKLVQICSILIEHSKLNKTNSK